MTDPKPRALQQILRLPSRSRLFGLIVLLCAVGFYFLVDVQPSDWQLNTSNLSDGLRAYENPAYVYPPWALILLWPYRWMTSRGSRIAAVLVAGWLTFHKRWTLSRFLLIILNPYFIFTLLLSNVDVLVLILPVVLWEAAKDTRWQVFGRGLALALLLVKPHIGGLVVLQLVWQSRKTWRALIGPLLLLGVITIPISLMGQPILLLQWLANLRNPSASNQAYWAFNNVSLAADIGFLPAIVVVLFALAVLWGLAVWRGRIRTSEHVTSGLFLASLMISPYSSHQSMVAAVTLIPSLAGVAAIYGIALGATLLGVYRPFDAWWTLLLGLLMLWFYRESVPDGQAGDPCTEQRVEQHRS